MGDFGRKNFRKVHSFDFVAMPDLSTVFAATKNPDEILPKLELISGSKIDRRYDVLVLDEIQDCGDALNSLDTTRRQLKMKIA